MRQLFFLILLLASLSFDACSEDKTSKEPQKQTPNSSLIVVDPLVGVKAPEETQEWMDKLSWMAGNDMGMGMKNLKQKVDVKMFLRGLKETYFDETPMLKPEEITSVNEQVEKISREFQKEINHEEMGTKIPVFPKELDKKFHWLSGKRVAEQIKKDGIKLNYEVFQSALLAQVNDEKIKYTKAEVDTIVKYFMISKDLKDRAKPQVTAFVGNMCKIQHPIWLENNKKNTDVTVTKSGLQYKILKEGSGAPPEVGDAAKVHVRASVLNGKTFDDTYSKGKPSVFKVLHALPAIREAVLLLKEGAKVKIWAPTELCYNEKGHGENIPAYSALEVEIELVKNLGNAEEYFKKQQELPENKPVVKTIVPGKK